MPSPGTTPVDLCADAGAPAPRSLLQDLLERVEAATGPDRMIDRALAFHLEGTGVEKERKLYAEMGDAMWVPDAKGLSPYDKARGDTIRSQWQAGSRGKRGCYAPVRWNSCDGPRPLTNSPAFTASLDAALALVERVLPGCWYVFGKGKLRAAEPAYGAQILFGADEVLGIAEHDAGLPLALLAALLSALIAGAPQ